MIQEKLRLLAEKLESIGDTFSSKMICDALSDGSILDSFLVSNELWGGSGSIADQAGIGDGVRTNDRREIEALLIDIGEEQIQLGKTNIRTSHWVHAFKTWRENGI